MYRKIHPWYLGIAIGLMEGIAIFIGTIVLVLQGEFGEAFLSRFFPFYTISVTGALIGLVEGFLDGFIGGAFIGLIYNFLIRLKYKPWK